MKKIVGIIAAVAMAASVFAVDISAGTKIKADLLNFTTKGNEFSMFKQSNDSHDYANPNFVLSISDDRAGATIKITTDGGAAVTQTTQTIWFKPFDVLKITLGTYDVALNKETIKYTESLTGLGTNGYLAQFDISGFTVDVGLNQGQGAYWFTNNKIENFFIKLGYSADFGSVGAYVAFNRPAPKSWENLKALFYGALGADMISNIEFGAGYKNTFDPITLFVNVIGFMDKGTFQWIRPEVFVSGNVNAFGFALFAAPGIFVGHNPVDANLEIVAKLTYALDAVTPYLQFEALDVLAPTFACTAKLGVTGSVSLMGYNIAAQLDVAGSDITISVPVELTVSF